MKRTVGLPDLHPGKGSPIGAAYIAKDCFYPHLVGGDIGCGMSLFQTDLKVRKIKLDKWTQKLHIEGPWNGDRQAFVEEFNLPDWDDALGTIGGGNHFTELQRVEKIVDEVLAQKLKLEKDKLQLMVHSGSRGLGQAILRKHTDKRGGEALDDDSAEGKEYIERHNYAMHFAEANRQLIARRFLKQLNATGHCLTDMTHNSVTACAEGWLHRKGAAPSDQEFVLIPGSRGSFSYVVSPLGDQQNNAWSLAHGAGRRWNRTQTKARLAKKYSQNSLRRTALGSRVICSDKELLYEEAPQAYKNIDRVIADLVELGLVKVVAVMKPVITYKTNKERSCR